MVDMKYVGVSHGVLLNGTHVIARAPSKRHILIYSGSSTPLRSQRLKLRKHPEEVVEVYLWQNRGETGEKQASKQTLTYLKPSRDTAVTSQVHGFHYMDSNPCRPQTSDQTPPTTG
jgi:hypothetical protein